MLGVRLWGSEFFFSVRGCRGRCGSVVLGVGGNCICSCLIGMLCGLYSGNFGLGDVEVGGFFLFKG